MNHDASAKAPWEIFAIKYAERHERTRRESFIMADDHDSPHPMDFFVWLIRSGDQSLASTLLNRFASAEMIEASTPKASPPTSPSAMHRARTISNRCRKRSLSRKRPCRFLENVE